MAAPAPRAPPAPGTRGGGVMRVAAILTAPTHWRKRERAAWPAFAGLVLTPYLATRAGAALDHASVVVRALDALALALLGCEACLSLSRVDPEDEAGQRIVRECVEKLVENCAHGVNSAGRGSVAVAACALLFRVDPWSLSECMGDEMEPSLSALARSARRYCRESRRVLDRYPPRTPVAASQETV